MLLLSLFMDGAVLLLNAFALANGAMSCCMCGTHPRTSLELLLPMLRQLCVDRYSTYPTKGAKAPLGVHQTRARAKCTAAPAAGAIELQP